VDKHRARTYISLRRQVFQVLACPKESMMKRLVLLLVLAALLAACESNPRPYPRYDNGYDDSWSECAKVKTGWAAGSDYPCAY
jgi:hypothetical protein